MSNTELKSCPFCGAQPVLEYKGGTCYDLECPDCGVGSDSVQICDLMTIEERQAEPDLTQENNYSHQPEYVERAKKKLIEYWNTRAETANSELVETIMLELCETLPASPEHLDTLVINYDEVKSILEKALQSAPSVEPTSSDSKAGDDKELAA